MANGFSPWAAVGVSRVPPRFSRRCSAGQWDHAFALGGVDRGVLREARVLFSATVVGLQRTFISQVCRFMHNPLGEATRHVERWFTALVD